MADDPKADDGTRMEVSIIIDELRGRSVAAYRRAQLTFALLCAVIVVGLGYYVGVPVWQRIEDAAKRSYETEARLLAEQLSEMDRFRDEIWAEIVDVTRSVVTPFRPAASGLFMEHIVSDDGTVIAFDDQNYVWWRSPDSTGFQRSALPGSLSIAAALQYDFDDKVLYFALPGESPSFGQLGWRAGLAIQDRLEGYTWPIFVSSDQGETWRYPSYPNGIEGDLTRFFEGHAVGEFLAVVDNQILHSQDGGVSWSHFEVPQVFTHTSSEEEPIFLDPVGRTFIDIEQDLLGNIHLISGEGIYAVWEADSSQWRIAPNTIGEPDFHEIDLTYDEGGALVELQLWDSNGVVTVSVDGGATWGPMAEPTFEESIVVVEDSFSELGEPHSIGANTFHVTYFGEIRRPDGAGGFEVVFSPNRLFETLNVAILGETAALISGVGIDDGVSFIASTDAGETWNWVPSLGSDREIRMGWPNLAVYPTSNGTGSFVIVLNNLPWAEIDGRYFSMFQEYIPAPGAEGDQEMLRLLSDPEPSFIEDSAFASLLQQFHAAIEQRDQLLSERNEAIGQAAAIASSGLSIEQRRRDFENFMQVCLGNRTEAAECAPSYVELSSNQMPSPWVLLAETAPQALLLLFLLGTLGGLYRYNMKLSGFHNSRADALVIASLNLPKNLTNDVTALADALAADRVEFGKGRSPSDQVADIAKAVAARGAS